jgi:hypothetical protein
VFAYITQFIYIEGCSPCMMKRHRCEEEEGSHDMNPRPTPTSGLPAPVTDFWLQIQAKLHSELQKEYKPS